MHVYTICVNTIKHECPIEDWAFMFNCEGYPPIFVFSFFRGGGGIPQFFRGVGGIPQFFRGLGGSPQPPEKTPI